MVNRVGLTVLGIGIAMIPLPGPAIAVIPNWSGDTGHGICPGQKLAAYDQGTTAKTCINGAPN
jgi:hypothetical protein